MVRPASFTAWRIVSRASWYSVQRVSFPHFVYSDSAMPTIAAASFIGASRDQSRRAELAPLVWVDAGRGEHLFRVLPEERWASREAPLAGRRDERSAGVEELPVELGMAHRDPEAAIVEVTIVEVLVRRPDRRPREPLALAGTVDLVGGVARAVRFERHADQGVEASAIRRRVAQRRVESIRRKQFEEAGDHVRAQELGDDRAHPDPVAGEELLAEDGARAHLSSED